MRPRLILGCLLCLFIVTFVTADNQSICADSIIVKFKPKLNQASIIKMIKGESSGISSLDRLIKKYQVQKIEQLFRDSKPPQDPNQVDLSRIYKVKFAPKFDPQKVAYAFSKDPYVEYAQTIGIHRITFRKGIRDKND